MTHPSTTRIRTPPGGPDSGSLSPNQRRLLERMRTLGFGIIRGLHVRAGEPVFDPLPVIVRVVRTTEPPPGPPRPAPESFVLCREQQTFLRHLTDLGDGVVDLIKVHDGLPVQLEIHLPA